MLRELEFYNSDYRENSVVALYSYCLMELLFLSGYNIREKIQGLFKYGKLKYGVTIGQTLQSILEKDQGEFNVGLASVLEIHEGMAKRGGLRATAEGLLCMPAMALAYAGNQYGLKEEVESDYYSKGYLDYLKSSTE